VTGQRVRVTLEGTRVPGDPDPVLRLRTDEGTLVFLPTRDHGVTLEVLDVPQPQGRYAVVEDRHGLEWVLAEPATAVQPWRCLTLDQWADWSDLEQPRLLSPGAPGE